MDMAYNHSRLNERAVEVPVGLALLDGHEEDALEVGAVLPHYLPSPFRHEVIDMREQLPGVNNINLFSFEPERQYRRIICISTLDHLNGAKEVLAAVERLKSWLADDGTLYITLPAGQSLWNDGSDWLDDLVMGGSLKMGATHRMDKVNPERHEWKEVPLYGTKALGYAGRGATGRWAHTVFLMFYGDLTALDEIETPSVDVSADDLPDYESMTVSELRELVEAAGMIGAGRLRKAELIDLLRRG
jgi:hypothetical protein